MSDDTTVLIVEDTYELAAVIQATLRHMSLTSHHSASAESALQYLRDHTPRLILLDIGMPGMNGWDFLDIVRQSERHQDVNVIVMTAFDSHINRARGENYNISAYIPKPFRPSELKTIISDLLHLT